MPTLPPKNTGRADSIRKAAAWFGASLSSARETGRTPDSADTGAQLRPGTASDLLSFVVVFGSAGVNAEFSREAE